MRNMENYLNKGRHFKAEAEDEMRVPHKSPGSPLWCDFGKEPLRPHAGHTSDFPGYGSIENHLP